MSADKKIPSPGSKEAILLGCVCPVMDNEYGKGYMGIADTFVINSSCKIHNEKEGIFGKDEEE
jgi:hypothetical protein